MTEELDRLAELVSKAEKCPLGYDWNIYAEQIVNAAPDLIALARWAEKARKLIAEDDESLCQGEDCPGCELLAAYPKGE